MSYHNHLDLQAEVKDWIKPRPRIQRALELTAQHLRGEINRPRANYSRKYGIYIYILHDSLVPRGACTSVWFLGGHCTSVWFLGGHCTSVWFLGGHCTSVWFLGGHCTSVWFLGGHFTSVWFLGGHCTSVWFLGGHCTSQSGS